jgi:N-acetylmuramoyl-L-alanine amidase
MKIFINPGHDVNYDSGAVNPNSGMREADVAASVGAKVAQYLIDAGCEVKVLQSDNLCHDSDHDLPCVVDEANAWNPDVIVSLHCNAVNGQARGTEVEVYPDDDKGARLACCIQLQIVDSLGTVDRGIKDRPNLAVLRATNAPAVLVEMAFIDNDNDADMLASRQDDFAAAIARGITDYTSKGE